MRALPQSGYPLELADNEFMPIAPIGFVQQDQLNREVDQAVAKLSKKEVVRVRYSVGVDSTGELAIFFRIVLTDAASKADVLADVTGRISATLFDELRPYENWGVIPYFNFRSKSEQDKRNEPEWA